MTDDMIGDVFPEDESPQDIQWATDSIDQPTFPEGAWTDKTALVEAPLEGHKYQVKFEGVYWTAIAPSPEIQLTPGDTVVVLGRDGNELIVQKQPERPAAVANPPLAEPLI
ncbi:NfeD family protein [Nodosilinea sp. PGN35]|uniref:NfeD family protein n=1 Tax=Nodosilinea sp. PGN35 TaxID=3020489 RepID=UPI0023B2A5D0|nr:NfeD family protein [Nodosilinea sp. TSF1-S3]MDF0368468.1 NfeD family protein [Nodosilinea sp. TSF1-S3]